MVRKKNKQEYIDTRNLLYSLANNMSEKYENTRLSFNNLLDAIDNEGYKQGYLDPETNEEI